jgi:ribose transport system ATP-binding protein
VKDLAKADPEKHDPCSDRAGVTYVNEQTLENIMTDTALLDASGVAKSFGAVRALTDAHLRVGEGEIVALMGANGAGKSTFVKIITGALRPDNGQVLIRGREAHVGSPAEARRTGLVPVYQEP